MTQEFLNKVAEKSKALSEEYKLDSLLKAYMKATEEEKEKIKEIYDKATEQISKMEDEFIAALKVEVSENCSCSKKNVSSPCQHIRLQMEWYCAK